MIYENEELRLRTININAEVERGETYHQVACLTTPTDPPFPFRTVGHPKVTTRERAAEEGDLVTAGRVRPARPDLEARQTTAPP